MDKYTIIAIFVVSLLVSLIWGVRWAYVCIFLPVLILLNQIPEVILPHLTVTAESAPMYGMILALPFRKESARFRFCSVDGVIALLLVSAAMTGWTTEFIETGFNALRNDVFRLGAPYFLGRIVFQDWRMRRWSLYVLIAVMAVVSACAVIEFLFIPYYYLHLLQKAGYSNPVHPMAYGRYGFYRVSGTVEHPIFFGNMCIVLLGMVAVLARTSGVKLRRIPVAVALFACVGCVVVSISFTPYMGLIAGTLALGTLTFLPFTRRLVLPMTLSAIVAGFGYTVYMAHAVINTDVADNGVQASLETRKVIIHQSWAKAVTAGPFGYGLRADFSDDDDWGLTSVDNSYMQFTLTRGWVYTGLWLMIAVTFSYRVQSAFKASTDRSQVFPLAVCTATVLGLMVAMFTVWAGALYTVVWIVMLGLGCSLIDAVEGAAADAADAAARAGRGRLRPPTVRLPVVSGGGGLVAR